MAVLEKIRVKFGLAISIIIALALLSFIIDPGTLQTVAQTMSEKFDVGSIGGKNISYTDFQADVERYTAINEIITGSSVQSEQSQKQIRDAAWQELLDRYMFIKAAKAAGITVGKDEIVALTTSENASPFIAQNPVFADEKGNFKPSSVVEFVQNIANDETGKMKIYWNYLQNTVNTQQYYAKYGSLFSVANYANNLVKEKAVALGNAKVKADIVTVNFGVQTDSTIVVSDSEIKEYYNKNKKNYKQNYSRDVEYVVFEVIPSSEDIAATADEMNKAYAEFSTTANMKNFLLKNSERSLSEYWYKKGELATINADIDAFVFGQKAAVSPIIPTGTSYFAARVMDSAMIPDSAYVKHILLRGNNAKKTADSLLIALGKGADFSAAALAHSVDQNSAADGQVGNIGWMTQSYMLPGFESVFTANLSKPFILNTRYGTHVVVVTKKTAPVAKKKVAILEKTTLASKETFNQWYAKANKFVTITSGSAEAYQKAVDSLGVYSHRLNITEGTSNYGSVENAKEVTRWAFDNKVGKASNIITVNQKYFFVVALKGINKEGYKPVKEVAYSIKNILYAEKASQKELDKVKAAIAGLTDMEQIAAAANGSLEKDVEVSLSSMSAAAVEPAVAGAMFTAKAGEISRPVKGMMGIYVFKVNNREDASFYTEEDAIQMEDRKSQYSSQMILPVLAEQYKVKDNRARFY